MNLRAAFLAPLLVMILAGSSRSVVPAGPPYGAQDTVESSSLAELVRLYEQRDYFTLRDRLAEAHAGEASGIRVLQAATAHAFNDLDRSNALLEDVLSEAALSDSLRYEARRIRARNLLRLHRYAEAGETVEELLTQAPAFVDSAEIDDYRNYLRIARSLEDVPPQRVTHRSATRLPRGERGMREIVVDGTVGRYGIDTGAGFSVLSRSEAERLGLEVRPAGVEMGTEPGVVTADLAVAHRVRLGEVEIRNVVFLVLPDEALTMGDFVLHGILGFPVAEALGEIRYLPDGTLAIPAEVPAREVRNLALHELSPYVRVGWRDDDLLCRLDTGGHATTFYEPLLRRHRARIEAEGTRDTARFYVAGGKKEIPSYRLDDVTLRFGGRTVALPEVHVFLDRVSRTESSNVLDCNLGADVLARADEYLFNFRSMSVLLGTPQRVASQEAGPGSGHVALVGGTVIASPEAEPLADAVVVVRDGRITAVGPSGSVQVPAEARVLSVEDQYVTAGFWNAHVHLNGFVGGADTLSDGSLAEALELGLTRWGFVRVVEPHTSDLENTLEIRRRIAHGSVPGPSILTTGSAFDPPGGNHIGLELPEITSPPEARKKIRARMGQGVDAIKLMTGSVSPDSVVTMPLPIARAAVETAHDGGLPVLAHPSNQAGTRIALEAGVDALAHVFATNVPPDWERGLVDRLLEQGTALIPTLMVFRASSVAEAQLRRFHERGGRVLFGTDLGYLTDPDPSSEYWLMARAGMRPRDILASLTTAPARFFGLEHETGRVEPGLAADLVVLDEDPLADATTFSSVRYVLREGRVIFDGNPWDPDTWERVMGRRYVPIERGIATLPADRWEGGPVELTAEEMQRYEGAYAWDEPLHVWVEGGLVRSTPIPGFDRMHLVPLGDHEFVQGLYRDGRLVEIYQPRVRVRFVMEGDTATAVIFSDGDWSSGRLERIE